MVIQPLLHISAYTFVHHSEVTQTMLPVTPMCLKAWSKVRTTLMENQEIPTTYIFYQMKTNYHLLNSKLVSLCWCFTTHQPHRCDHLHIERGCQKDDFPATLHSAPGSCSITLYAVACIYTKSIFHFRQTSQQTVSPTWRPPVGSHRVQRTLISSRPSGRWLSLLLTPAWCNQSSYKALQLEQEDQAIRWKPPHFTLPPLQFCISKLEVTSPN